MTDVRFVAYDEYLPQIEALREEGYNMCIDVCAVDYLTAANRPGLPEALQPERFEVVVNLLSHSMRKRVRLRLQVREDNPVAPSLFDLYPGSEAMEREAYDLMGIRFEGHSDLTRILMPEEWEGHPLRKDYAQGRIPVQFKYTEGKYEARSS